MIQINEEALEQEMHAWVERRIQLQNERIQRSGHPASESEVQHEADLRNLSGDELFRVYQNNFWIRLKMASIYFEDNGVVKPEHASGHTIKAFHLVEIRQSILELGYELQVAQILGWSDNQSRKLTSEELAIVKVVFLKMRNRGYSHRELMG
ncbi:MAG: hypothetical protein A2431_01015 [Candidatus Zambryskibacteria bacterium RIFOXYC1_FULL_39_10]|uniref:Uncharacterized protein n=1 Tax=Candidatus Zambryskibacteria bacterium RIFOXYC1_FULL_39_10 TaxID=1802779 RepID=A0A1G2V2G7_9BACT|nr:MAG: hypothetical protein A2431_01015 [Candidatus Zambryskibacteria bacterium RIFOXYC1_FULL_39_10]OHB16880.1 MAG: hypothetical protein A2605_00225 [Candidatus Zambryskibacteria bacterium RIFOXYD1_FULL_39_35]